MTFPFVYRYVHLFEKMDVVQICMNCLDPTKPTGIQRMITLHTLLNTNLDSLEQKEQCREIISRLTIATLIETCICASDDTYLQAAILNFFNQASVMPRFCDTLLDSGVTSYHSYILLTKCLRVGWEAKGLRIVSPNC